ncbi:MAG: S8 family serine peptidase, partial [Thermoplasmata archaeon]|nr:S8 family serine peptidase [Thermoplasmata archaeon]
MKEKILAACVMILLILLTASPSATSARGDMSILSPSLREKMSSPEPLEVLVHFQHDVREPDLLALRSAGLEPLHTFDFIDAVYAKGMPRAVLRTTLLEGVDWIEHNDPLEHMMDGTTTVINATLAWNTRIKDTAGNILPGIDGTGVTAVILDSGVDAGHPDLDYGEKTIMNLKSDTGVGPWYEIENSDTSSGHGTHCAGTVAGNGDASGGARAGVAPGANLIGLSTGEAVAIINALGALEWVYENTRPGQNPYNIRVVSNSWGSSADYDASSGINDAIRRITYENNVVVVFAAGNAGEENHDGHEVTTNPYSLEPSAICVAATSHDGKEMAVFSSRGAADDDFTWPDIGAPGVKIWSTAARRTMISAMTAQGRGDAYYLAISGTSMATPHISGVVALLWQACPSLRVANMSDDNSLGGSDYHNDTNNRVHEAELILELSAHY